MGFPPNPLIFQQKSSFLTKKSIFLEKTTDLHQNRTHWLLGGSPALAVLHNIRGGFSDPRTAPIAPQNISQRVFINNTHRFPLMS